MAAKAWPSLPLLSTLQATPGTILSILCLCFLFYFTQYRRRSSLPVNWPVVGLIPSLVANFFRIHEFLVDTLRDANCTFIAKGPWLISPTVVMTCDPANVNHALGVNFNNYPKGQEFGQIFDFLGDGIFNSDGEAWNLQRKAFHNFISDRSFRSFVAATIKKKVEKGLMVVLDDLAATGETFDVQGLFVRLSYDFTSNVVYGVDQGCLESKTPDMRFSQSMDQCWEALLIRHVLPSGVWKTLRWLRIGHEKTLDKACKFIDEYIYQVISARRKEIIAQNPDESRSTVDLLTHWINHPVADGEGVFGTNKFLRDTVLTFMIAGRGGLAANLSWLFWLLSKNPDVEKKILEELRAHAARKSNGFVTGNPIVFDPEEVDSMVYLHGAVCEALRLYPPVPYEEKTVMQPEVLPSGHEVMPGSRLLVSVYAMGRMEVIWGKDCLEFKPERWISESGGLKHVPAHKFMVFNFGPRVCPGRGIALMLVKTVAAAVLSNFAMEFDPGNVIELKSAVLLRMKNPLRVRVSRRSL